jgi:alpha-N-acetylglucosamine transferase
MVQITSRRRIIYVLLASVMASVCVLITLHAYGNDMLRTRFGSHSHNEEKEKEKEKEKEVERPRYVQVENHGPDGQEKLAYVTFLSGTVYQDDDLENDNYLQAVRILVWQLVHVPGTRTKHDVVVMVTPNVSKSRRERLKKDGAIVYPVEFLHVENDDWIKPETRRFDDVMTKMRVWEMTQYSRILMLDGDSMLRSSLDGVFDDPGAQLLQTKDTKLVNYTALEGEAPLPETYLLASLSEVWDSSHSFPPGQGTGLKDIGNMNAGFFMMAPSISAFKFYTSLLSIPNSFDPILPEQNLINLAHKWSGPMPWREVAYTWNVRCPNENDFKQNVVSVHEKWWRQPFIYESQPVKDWLLSRRYEMKGWYNAYDYKKENATR